MYLLGRGSVYIGTRDAAGAILAVKEFHCPEFEISVETEHAEHWNSSGEVKARDVYVAVKEDAKARIVLDEHDSDVFAMALGGTVTKATVGATFTAKAFPGSTIAAGDKYPVPGGYANLASLTITDSAGTPATLAAGTNYTVDLAAGVVTFTLVAGFTQPFKAAGAEANNSEIVSIATKGSVEKFVRFDGINIADNNKTVIVDLYRASFSPNKVQVKTEGNDVHKSEFEAVLLKDSNAPFSAAFGQFGRYVKG